MSSKQTFQVPSAASAKDYLSRIKKKDDLATEKNNKGAPLQSEQYYIRDSAETNVNSASRFSYLVKVFIPKLREEIRRLLEEIEQGRIRVNTANELIWDGIAVLPADFQKDEKWVEDMGNIRNWALEATREKYGGDVGLTSMPALRGFQ
ncbi:hypothetical protein SAMD00023353_0100600 [Rosellinia necatrix]|uniref:Uncharacterized protein n=1 Tax=Rosellinia necatrix TaxID=77044 RepID=A0A1S7UHA4_ROSNE|nr:hypothetical protein SAMD00023353_0100600 [Rosellinia necatrix]